MYNDIIFEKSNRVATITINRVQFSNALAASTYDEIKDAISSCEKDDEIGSIVITGKGKHFSAGGDIVRFKELIDNKIYLKEDAIAKAGEMSKQIRLCSKPVIAMINGVATGAGLSIALACDFRVGTESSKLIMAFVKMGLSGDTGSIYFLNKLLGVAKATELIMTGRPLTGQEAYRLNLLNILAKEDCLADETYKLADQLANSALFAIKKQKELINKYFYSELIPYMEDETVAMASCSRTGDFEEAVNAFLKKEVPHFTGK